MSRIIYSTSPEALQDAFGRIFPYLRLSLTDVCNFRCQYCLPKGYVCSSKPNFLSVQEIERLLNAFTSLGVVKVRLTGGEPTIRQDFKEIAKCVSANTSIKQVAFTTNGYQLHQHAHTWRQAGLTHINVSVDSLNANRFKQITGHDRLAEVLKGIDAAVVSGYQSVKVNTVLLKNVNDTELPKFLHWVKDKPISIRFIELMQTGDNFTYFSRYHTPASNLQKQLEIQGWKAKPHAMESGPAIEYAHPGYTGTVGIIAPYSKDFCLGCNRLRVTATGDLRLCLFGEQGSGLRHLLQYDYQINELKQHIQAQLQLKCSSHFLAAGDTGATPHLASIGG